MPPSNHVTLMGNLTRDVELRNSGVHSVASFGIAVNKKFTTASGEKRESVLFIDCSAWGKAGEIIAKYFSSGDKILINGELKLDLWETKDGEKRSRIGVTVREFDFIPNGKGGDSSPAPRDESAPQSSGSPAASMDDEPPFS